MRHAARASEKQSSPVAQQLLLVDDRSENLVFLRDYLKTKGFMVFTAEHGEAALACLKTNQIDLMILDLELPGMSGLEILAVVRQSVDAHTLPVVILTAHPTDEVEAPCYAGGANLVLSKPVRLRKLHHQIETILSGQDPKTAT